MSTRIPFSNVSCVNKSDTRDKQPLSDKVIHEKSEKLEKSLIQPTQQEITQIKNSLDEQLESMDKQTLIQTLKMHKLILKFCFDENDAIRDRMANIEAKFSHLQDEIELRDKVILELNEKLELLQQPDEQ